MLLVPHRGSEFSPIRIRVNQSVHERLVRQASYRLIPEVTRNKLAAGYIRMIDVLRPIRDVYTRNQSAQPTNSVHVEG